VLKSASPGSLTRGLVGDVQFAVLSDITPVHSLFFTVLAQLPFLINLWRPPGEQAIDKFLLAVVGCAYSSFLFSWHVHEKAILIVIVPMMYVHIYLRFFVSIRN
jgi:alpha-1,3-glucosyltransferase